jgi:hypothetical protein
MFSRIKKIATLAIICTAAIIALSTPVPALADGSGCCPEQGQWANMGWSFEFGDDFMRGILGHDMGQWMCPDGIPMSQTNTTYGNFHLENNGLTIDLRTTGWEYQANIPDP